MSRTLYFFVIRTSADICSPCLLVAPRETQMGLAGHIECKPPPYVHLGVDFVVLVMCMLCVGGVCDVRVPKKNANTCVVPVA